MTMKTPTHPGETVRIDCIEALGLSITAAAEGLGVSRNALSEIVNGRTGISAEMAIRLEMAGWSTADTWLGMQKAYDLAQARRHADKLKVRRFPQAEPA